MPILRTPFSATVEPSEPLVLDAVESGASFRLFLSSMTSQRRSQRGPQQGPAPAKGAAGPDVPLYSVLFVQTEIMTAPVAIGGVDATALDTRRVRAVIPVMRGQGKVTLTVQGPDAIVIAGDQHTIVSREQCDAVGFKASQKK